MESRAAFRPEDEALLEELEDEVLVGRLFATHTGRADARPLPARASGLVGELRSMPGGLAAIEAALAEPPDAAPILALLLADDLVRKPPRFVHHVAIYFERVAETYEAEIARASGEPARGVIDAYLEARTRSLAAFFALHAERSYLADYARRVAGGSLVREEAEATAATVATNGLDQLGALARAGARDLSARGRIALAALARTAEACRIAGVDASTAKQLVRRADSVRASAVDEALAPVLDGLTEARVRDDGLDKYIGLFDRVRRIWHWSGRDEAVERFAVDEITGIAWIVYRKAKWQDLHALLAPCFELHDSLAARIESDPKRHLAYSAKCAQMFVFRSDATTDKQKEWEYAERSIRLCSTHRNGRLSVAHLLCNRAIARLEATWFPSAADVDAARADIARAEELFPQSTRLPAAKAKLEEVVGRMTGG